MPRIQLLVLLGAIAALVGAPDSASARFFVGDTVDGPSADIDRVGGVDVARDGTGTLVYLKRVAGIDHVFAARLLGGRWAAPERLDPGLVLPSADPVVGVANGGAAIVAFTNNGQLHVIVRRPSDGRWPAPAVLSNAAATPSIDLSVNGVGYVVWSSDGDVRAATLDRTGRTFTPLEDPLDVTVTSEAGGGLGRPKVAVSADGTALAAWGEGGHVYARRLFHAGPPQGPQQLDVPMLAGHGGGVADTPEADIADDSSFAWVTFREAFDTTTTRVLARRLVGSAFDPPADVGAGAFGREAADSPAVDVAGSGDAVFASETTTSHAPFVALDHLDVLHPPFGLGAGSGSVSAPAVAVGESSQATAAWFAGAAGAVTVHARGFKRAVAADAEATLSDPSLGPVDPLAGLHAAADRFGDVVVPYVQGPAGARRLAVGVWDRPPTNLKQLTTTRRRRPGPLTWAPVAEAWGPIVYSVIVDGKRLGTTRKTTFPIAGRVRDGRHTWRLVATDQRGQRGSTGRRTLRIKSSG